MYRLKKQAFVLFIIFIIFTILGLISIAVIQLVDFLRNIPFLPLGVAIITILYAAIAFINLNRLNSYNEQIRSLHIENRYNLSRESLFFNYAMMEKRVNELIKIHRREGSYIIAFTASKRTVMRNLYRNNTVTQLNGFISDYLNSFIDENKDFNSRDFAFCYYHGQFIIYTTTLV